MHPSPCLSPCPSPCPSGLGGCRKWCGGCGEVGAGAWEGRGRSPAPRDGGSLEPYRLRGELKGGLGFQGCLSRPLWTSSGCLWPGPSPSRATPSRVPSPTARLFPWLVKNPKGFGLTEAPRPQLQRPCWVSCADVVKSGCGVALWGQRKRKPTQKPQQETSVGVPDSASGRARRGQPETSGKTWGKQLPPTIFQQTSQKGAFRVTLSPIPASPPAPQTHPNSIWAALIHAQLQTFLQTPCLYFICRLQAP